jgi:hypothetical protein
MDYTPTTFSNLRYPHLTTYAHELALSLVFNSGILHFGDNAESYRSVPAYVQEFLKTVPATFDETRFISGEPGKSIIIASRKGKVWYLAGINSEKERMESSIRLPFLGSGKYSVNLIKDGADAKSFQNELHALTQNEALPMTIAGYGGFVATVRQQ